MNDAHSLKVKRTFTWAFSSGSFTKMYPLTPQTETTTCSRHTLCSSSRASSSAGISAMTFSTGSSGMGTATGHVCSLARTASGTSGSSEGTKCLTLARQRPRESAN
ncbi:hypothetical protein GDO78_013668 [Eleutherodactylus coqui]|uniref:Uncharacterized protein n=1 Tax=Eleutherodactylus coqui TaxID=57060 RepID=A0A8J6E755_ELECQ|nr:hypothetical protein GDO78_013668 [Eleutherodactylus coqui]